MELGTYTKNNQWRRTPTPSLARQAPFASPARLIVAGSIQPYTLPTIFNKYVSSRPSPPLRINLRSVSINGNYRRADPCPAFVPAVPVYLSKCQREFGSYSHDQRKEQNKTMPTPQPARKNILESLKHMLGFSTRHAACPSSPYNGTDKDSESKLSVSSLLQKCATFESGKDGLQPDFLGYMPRPRRQQNKGSPSPYGNLPPLGFPSVDVFRKVRLESSANKTLSLYVTSSEYSPFAY